MQHRSFGPLFVCWASFWLGKRAFPGRAFVLAIWLGWLLFGPSAWAASAPTITNPPANQVLAEGETLNLSVTATGPGPLTYQWLKDGRMILGATNSALNMANAGVTNSGIYYVAVANAYGLSISRPVTVTDGSPQLMGWGNGQTGALGDAPAGLGINFSPITVAGNVVAAAAGGGFYLNGTTTWDYSYSLLLKSDGTLWAVGDNLFGQLGDGTTSQRNSPVAVAGGTNVVAVAAGDTSSLFLKSDGTLWAMGDNNYGQLGDGTTSQRNSPVAVDGGTNVVAMAVGGAHSLFLKSDGTVWAMGKDGYGQLGDGGHPVPNVSHPIPVAVASNVVAVAAGQDHSLFLKADGTLWSTGYNAYGQLGNGAGGGNWEDTPVAVLGGTNVLAMAAGYNHSLFLKSDGTLWAMGANVSGQLGNGSASYSEVDPVAVVGGSNVVAVTAGNIDSLFLKSDGTLWAMGDNSFGELGDGFSPAQSSPVSVPGMYLATVISGCNAQHTLAVGLPLRITSPPASQTGLLGGSVTFSVTADGAGPLAYQWYFNGTVISGATGQSYTLTGMTVTNVGSYTVAITGRCGTLISSGATLTLPSVMVQPTNAVAAGGTVTLSVPTTGPGLSYQWRKDRRVIPGATNNVLTLANAGVPDSGVYYVTLANGPGLSITLPVTVTVGTPQLMAWGQNTYNQLGDGTASNRSHPEPVATNVLTAAGGRYHSLFVKGDGTLWSMGYNTYGQLGNGSTSPHSKPVSVTNNVVAVAAGFEHSLFVTSDGTLWAMGFNNDGQLGDGTTTDQHLPESVASNVVAVAAGSYHSLYLKGDGTLWAMGDNTYGELGHGTMNGQANPVLVTNNVVAVAAGGQHSLFLKHDGTLWAMGQNNNGQLGDGTTTQRNSPVFVTNNVAAMAGGAFHSLYLKGDGTLWAMGDNQFGGLGDGTTTQRNHPVAVVGGSDVIALAAGAYHSLFLQSNGMLWTMGYNVDGELGDGTTTQRNSPVPVSSLLLANINAGACAFQSFAAAVPVNATGHPPVAVDDTLGTVKDQAFSLPAAKLAANDTDVDGNALTVITVSLSSTAGGTVSLTAGILTYNPPAGFSGADSFTYTISDGHGNLVTGTVQVAIDSSAGPALNRVYGPVVTNGNFVVRFAGTPGCAYTIESTASLVAPITWQKTTNLTAPNITSGSGKGVFEFSESTGRAGARYYRTVFPAY
ncbi:MAG: immunoglobulin domain-containing protein [Verrucomicrobiota bacterium]